MKKMKSVLMLMAIAAASFSFSSCDDDPYYHGNWRDPYGWYNDYNHGGWGWNDRNWNQGAQGSQNNQLLDEAAMLVDEWYGPVLYSYIQEDGVSRGTDEFYADMVFYQTGNKVNSLSGNGIETDYIYNKDGSVADQQTLKFSWYIDNNGDIYVKYTESGATFVMDAGASQYGFNLGYYDNNKYKIFKGYMIGTGKVKGDVIYMELKSVSGSGKGLSNVRKLVRSASEFGKGATRQPLGLTNKKLNSRR